MVREPNGALLSPQCPKCNICIEKNGGCNHMQCSKCKHDFCWMCLGDWKTHGSDYYECSRYKENPDIVNQSQQAQAREALKKYLFYFERWENHNKSLQLEAQTYQRIHEKIQERVINNLGTWIDWQYLQNAAKLLAKVCPASVFPSLVLCEAQTSEGGRHCRGQGSPPVKSCMCLLMGPQLPRLCPLRTLPSPHIQGTQYSGASACGDRTTGKTRALLFFCPIHASLRGK